MNIVKKKKNEIISVTACFSGEIADFICVLNKLKAFIFEWGLKSFAKIKLKSITLYILAGS